MRNLNIHRQKIQDQFRLQRATREALLKWKGSQQDSGNGRRRPVEVEDEILESLQNCDDVLASITRRPIDISVPADVNLPLEEPITFKTSRLKAFSRVIVWFYMILSFLVGNLWDVIWRRDCEQRRAVRLRRTFEKVGGTFIKFGQQMSMRIDLLPWAYTYELSKMLDRIPPFPVEEAIESIERTTGKKWEEIFAVFDPDPIGSASVACVYQAILKNGDKVAVKVRRPQIGELFMADFKAFDWLLDIAEFLTFFRPGYTQNIRQEFKTTLLEELDFVLEARFQDMFRSSAHKTGKGFFTAPKLYFEYCNEEVIVQEYSSGLWLYEITAGVEHDNPEALKRMRELNIDPKKVAQRLLWVNYWGMQENLFFHADPHPANVIVSQNSKLTFIDFGSCGSFNQEQRAGLELTAVSSAQNDAEGMARGTLKLFEPLPPLDVKELLQEAEAEYTRVLTIFRSKQEHTEWWERTSVRQWMSFFKFSRDNNIPVSIHTLRMIRATLLYDTIAVRISKEVDRFDEYMKFKKFREKQAKKRVTKSIRKQTRRGLDDSVFLRAEEIAKTGEKLMYRTRGFLSSPIYNFGSLIGKWVFTLSLTIRLVGRAVLLTLFGAGMVAGAFLVSERVINLADILKMVLSNPLYQVALIFTIIINIRHILFRLRDYEV
jgi:predicted unusual protein kinase regulating ubiquinone biosynthesis (AarF/ABC1/UbiB family)